MGIDNIQSSIIIQKIKGLHMTPQKQELDKNKHEIISEMRAIFKTNMKIFDWDIPENDDKASAQMIVQAMQEALDELKKEVDEGKYDQY
jgi:hypothetical protein